MEKLAYDQWVHKEIDDVLWEHARYAPDDSVCPRCTRFIQGHAGLEQILAIRRLKYYDEDRGIMVTPQGGIPYCSCNPSQAEVVRPRYSE